MLFIIKVCEIHTASAIFERQFERIRGTATWR